MHQVHDWREELAEFDPAAMRMWEHRWFGPHLIIRGRSGWLTSAKSVVGWKLGTMSLDQVRDLVQRIRDAEDAAVDEDDDTLTEPVN